jgi:hypothetical protein
VKNDDALASKPYADNGNANGGKKDGIVGKA